jgi:hypothetical protein
MRDMKKGLYVVICSDMIDYLIKCCAHIFEVPLVQHFQFSSVD